MGYLTTITIYNDRLHEIEENPEKFVEDISKYVSKGKMERFDYAIAQTKIHKTRHADDQTVYVHIGNTVIDVNSDEMKRIKEEFPQFYTNIIHEIEWNLEQLKDED